VTALENPHAGQGAVVLDIGGDIGAVLVWAPDELAGAEIEICPAGRRGSRPDEGVGWWSGEWRRHHRPDAGSNHDHHHRHHDHGPAWPHVAVLGRPTPGGETFGAVFPGLRAGRYELWRRPDGPTALEVEVDGGRVTSATWPSPEDGSTDSNGRQGT
jgi:hypothetical protein